MFFGMRLQNAILIKLRNAHSYYSVQELGELANAFGRQISYLRTMGMWAPIVHHTEHNFKKYKPVMGSAASMDVATDLALAFMLQMYQVDRKAYPLDEALLAAVPNDVLDTFKSGVGAQFVEKWEQYADSQNSKAPI